MHPDGSPGNDITTEQLTTWVAQVFPDASVCDHVIKMCDSKAWSMIPSADQAEYIDCVNKRIQGDRLNALNENIPKNIMYAHEAPMTFINNLVTSARERLTREHERIREQRQRRRRTREFVHERLPSYRERFEARKQFAYNLLVHESKISVRSPIFDAMLKFDQMWFKWKSGYYGELIDEALTRLDTDDWNMPTTKEALHEMKNAAQNVVRTMWNQPYRELIHKTRHASNTIQRIGRHVWERGLFETWREEKKARRDAWWHSKGKRATKQRDEYLEMLRHSPLYLWWNAPAENKFQNPFKPFVEHMRRTIERHRDTPRDKTLFTLDQRFAATRDAILARWRAPEWNDECEQFCPVNSGGMGYCVRHHRNYDECAGIISEFNPSMHCVGECQLGERGIKETSKKLDNWNKVRRVFYKTYDYMWPNTLTRDIQERFVFNCNCILADRLLNVTINIIDYCANEFMPNFNFTRRTDMDLNFIDDYLKTTSPHRRGGFYHHEMAWKWHHPTPEDPDAWIRPKVRPEIANAPRNVIRVERGSYRRAMTSGNGQFNLIDQIICWIENLLDTPLNQDLDMFFEEVRQWFLNPNTLPSDYPDVGFLYWATFWFRCEFPESLNCAVGIGLEAALGKIIVISFIVFVLISFIFPASMMPLMSISAFLFYVVAVPAVAWHYSPQCWFMTPSFPIGVGVNIPILPIPVAFPALPECAFDEIMSLFDKYITYCYDFVIQPYMVNGPVCGLDETQHIDFINCKDVGVSDGLQNLIYLGYRYGGAGFCDFVMQLVTTCFGRWFPGLADYMTAALEGFKNANPTQMQRQEFCFWFTLPTILLPLFILAVVGIVLALIVPALVDLFVAFIYMFTASPFYVAFPGGDAAGWDDLGDYDATRLDADVAEFAGRRVRPSTLERMIYPRQKQE
jgi:hypothetical protein